MIKRIRKELRSQIHNASFDTLKAKICRLFIRYLVNFEAKWPKKGISKGTLKIDSEVKNRLIFLQMCQNDAF